MKKIALLAVYSLLVLLSAPSVRAEMIGIGVNASGAVVTPWNAEDFADAIGYNVGADFNVDLLFLHADLDAQYTGFDGNQRYEARASADVLILQIQELHYRNSESEGKAVRGMAGIGFGFDLPKSLGRISASAGAMAMQWTNPGEAQRDLLGLYAGANLKLRIWKVENELRVAYYRGQEEWRDFIPENHPENYARDYKEGWDSGIIASERAYVQLFKISVLAFGPELRAQIANLPDGTEWMTTLGVSGHVGY
jgi:hypothetical protein